MCLSCENNDFLSFAGTNRDYLYGNIYGRMFYEDYSLRVRPPPGGVYTFSMELSRFSHRRHWVSGLVLRNVSFCFQNMHRI